MNFNNVYNNLMSTLFESNKTSQTIFVVDELPNDYRDLITSCKRTDRHALAISVQPPHKKGEPVYVIASTVFFETYDDSEPSSQWWDANHDVLYQGSSASEAQKVLKETLLKLPHRVWKNRVSAGCINELNTKIETLLQKLTIFTTGTWKVIIDDVGDDILTIGVEIDIAPYLPERQAQEDLYGF
jgi:hypothetical protein